MSREKELAKNTLILSIGTFLPKFAALITIPIITGYLTKVEYGTYDLIATLVSLFLPIATLQIQSAAFRFLIDCRDDVNERKRVISNIYGFLIPISVLALTILFFALHKISFVTRILIVGYFFVDILMSATQQIVRGLSENKLYSMSSVIQSIVNMLLVVLTVSIARQGLNGVLVSVIVATIVSIVLLTVKSGILRDIDFRLKSVSLVKKMLGYSWPMIPNTLSSWVLSTSDRLVLTGFMGLEAVATYAAANKIPMLFTSVQGTFIFAWQENASLALSDSDVEKYYSNMFDRVFSILSGIMALLIGTTPILFWLLIRGNYGDSYPQMPILFMGVFFSAISSFMGGIYVAHKRTKNVGLTTMLAAVCNLAIDLGTVQSIGIYAASISTLVSYTLLSIYRMHDVKSFQKISYNYSKIGISITVLAGMCILCWVNTFTINIINVVIGIIFAFLLNKELFKSIIRAIISKLKKGNRYENSSINN